jgi:hypothetical protein
VGKGSLRWFLLLTLLLLSVFFFFNYSNESGQLAILISMSILEVATLLSMAK